MGIWGVGLYQNDTSLDVKDEFDELFRIGKTAQEITDKLMSDYTYILDDRAEAPLFWLALADAQWNEGVLLPSVREKALSYISSMLHSPITDVQTKTQGKEVLDELQAKLLSPQPPMKKPVKKGIYKCHWKLGDVFAYRLESDLAKERGLYGRYFLIQKVDEASWHPGHIVPIVYVKITNNSMLPSNVEEYNQLEYVQPWFTKYENRFFPIDMSRPEEDIAEKSKINYQVDEYGFLPEYRLRLLNTSKKVIPSKLIFIGNFANANRPNKEFIPHVKENIGTVSWTLFDETFETILIQKYCWHNLRELSIYQKKDKGTVLLSPPNEEE